MGGGRIKMCFSNGHACSQFANSAEVNLFLHHQTTAAQSPDGKEWRNWTKTTILADKRRTIRWPCLVEFHHRLCDPRVDASSCSSCWRSLGKSRRLDRWIVNEANLVSIPFGDDSSLALRRRHALTSWPDPGGWTFLMWQRGAVQEDPIA